MNCKTCDYPLWNLEARTCPECGTPFKPSEYVFTANSVRFCCPSCKQAYYGTSMSGHLVPNEFECVTCHRALAMDEMVLLPTLGVAEQLTRGDVMPWLERKRIGWIRAWFATAGRVMADPSELIKLVPKERSGGEALVFGVLTLAMYSAANFSMLIVPSWFRDVAGGSSLNYALAFVAGNTLLLGALAALIMVQAFVAHVILTIGTGTELSWRRALHAFCYSTPTAAFFGLPCVGFFAAPITMIWWWISAGMMLKAAYRASGLRSAMAAAAVPVMAVLLAVLVFWVYVPPNMTRTGPASWTWTSKTKTNPVTGKTVTKYPVISPNATEASKKLATSLEEYQDNHSALPAHGFDLCAKGTLLFTDFFPQSRPEDFSLAGVALSTTANFRQEQLRALEEAAEAQLPSNWTMHRVGDYVFVYRGIDIDTMSSKLWLAVLLSEHAVPGQVIESISADGSVEVITDDFASALKAQNQLRAKAGLAPLEMGAGGG